MSEGRDDGQPTPGPTGTITTVHGGLPVREEWTGDAARYELGDEIARGGGGRVVAAVDQRLGRAVAVKLPLEEGPSPHRLVREAQLMARLEHPSIVPVHDLVRDASGRPYYVMKLLAGDTLRARIAGRPFEDRIALLPTLIAIAEAVAYAHHHGIVHRDLKPANVIVGSFGETFVIDWGLARRLAGDPAAGSDPPALTSRDDITVEGAVVGTPAYMAPEQARGEAVDVRTDVYGLGALAYHVLGGEAPYADPSSSQVIARVVGGPPLPLAEREPRVPAELAAIVGKAMARAPAARYPSAQELAVDLRHYQAGRLVAAHRYSLGQRARRAIRRHRVAIAGGAVAIAAGVALVIAWPSGDSPAAMCERAGRDAGRALDGAWPPTRRAAIVERARALRGPGAATAAGVIGARVEAYTRDLVAGHVEACAATHVSGSQSSELLDRRVVCLGRRAQDLAATLTTLEGMAATEIDGGVHATGQLPEIASCGNPELLRDRVPLPTDPQAHAAADALYTRLAAIQAQQKLGRYRASLQPATEVVASIGPTTYAPYAGKAHYLLGETLYNIERYDDATKELHAALTTAEIGHDDELRADTLDRLAATAVEQARGDPKLVPEATRLLSELSAIATRLDAPRRLAYGLEHEAIIAIIRGDQQHAIELSRRALELQERAHNLDGIAMSAGNLSAGLLEAGRTAEALPYVDRSMAVYKQLYGNDHPNIARTMTDYGAIYLATGRGAEAVDAYRRAYELLQRAGLGETQEAASFRGNLAAALGGIGRTEEAEAELVAVLKLLGDDPLQRAHVLVNLGLNRGHAKQHPAAERWLRQAVELCEQKVAADHPLTAVARTGLAIELIELGRSRDALPLLEAAVPILTKESPGSDELAAAQIALARVYLDTGRPQRALEVGTPALDFYARFHEVANRGEARLVIARALAAAGLDRARAVELATLARADFEEAKAPEQVTAVDRLLAQLRR